MGHGLVCRSSINLSALCICLDLLLKKRVYHVLCVKNYLFEVVAVVLCSGMSQIVPNYCCFETWTITQSVPRHLVNLVARIYTDNNNSSGLIPYMGISVRLASLGYHLSLFGHLCQGWLAWASPITVVLSLTTPPPIKILKMGLQTKSLPQ